VDTGLIKFVKSCITFIFVYEENAGAPKPCGTGFLVGVPLESDPTKVQVFLVTAKHVLHDQSENYLKDIVVRLNLRIGGSELIKIPIDEGKLFVHDDPDVDIVAYPLNPNATVYDYGVIMPQNFATKEVISNNEISEGEDVFFAGLFESHIGQRQNQPIMRFGKLSLMTDEKIEWTDPIRGSPRYTELYLMECLSFGGNSGSPVFFYLSPTRKSNVIYIGPAQIHLAGIIKGSFHQTDILGANTFLKQNVGIAAVTPTYKLSEILYSESLRAFRKSITP
jgi:hypothetical protein